jgi:AcrR family transcriptional regulator
LRVNAQSKLAALRFASSVDSPKTRILDTAGKLFYRHGIRSVSVDVIAKEAGTNKMTLYKYFESKDELVAEYLRRLTSELDSAWDAIDKAFPNDPDVRMRAHIEQEVALITYPGEYATAFVNAFVELMEPSHPAWPVIREQKAHSIERLCRLFRAAKIKQPERLADKLHLLTEGARINMQCNPHGPVLRIASILSKTIEDHIRPPRAKRKGKLRKSLNINKVIRKRPAKVMYDIPIMPSLASSDAAMPPKDRILVAAGELFQRHGIHAVSVGTIAKAAGTNKMTLYYHYASKDVLISEYLRNISFINNTNWARTEQAFPDPWERVQALLTGVYDGVSKPLTSGGAMARAAIELKEIDHPAVMIIQAQKQIFLKRVVPLFKAAKMADPAYLGDITQLMIEGGRISSLSYSPDGPAARTAAILAAIYEDYANRAIK